MSRIANNPVPIPAGVDVSISGDILVASGQKGELMHKTHPLVTVRREDNLLRLEAKGNSKFARAMSGTTRALIQNIITGVDEGYERRLEITGVGYRAQVQGDVLNLTLGFSHPVTFRIPDGITIETPSQTEIVIRGIDKQKVGQVAALIRHYRPPEPYKGKGVKYLNEKILRKEAKKT